MGVGGGGGGGGGEAERPSLLGVSVSGGRKKQQARGERGIGDGVTSLFSPPAPLSLCSLCCHLLALHNCRCSFFLFFFFVLEKKEKKAD